MVGLQRVLLDLLRARRDLRTIDVKVLTVIVVGWLTITAAAWIAMTY